MDREALQLRMKKLFTEGFTVLDIAEPLLSFDAPADAAAAALALESSRDLVGGVRRDGRVIGYVRTSDLKSGGSCGDHVREIETSRVVQHRASLPEVVQRLGEDQEYCFVSVLGQIDAFVARPHFEKPPARMWLFGMITIAEIFLTETIESVYPDDVWTDLVPTGRMRKARELHAERMRRQQPVRLVDCLQLGDKMQILIREEEWRPGARAADRATELGDDRRGSPPRRPHRGPHRRDGAGAERRPRLITLETERLCLRPLSMDDLEDVHRMHSDPETIRYASGRVKSREESLEWLKRAIDSYETNGHGFWAVELKPSGDYVGHAGLLAQIVDDVPETEIAYWILRKHWGRGLATEAAIASRDHGFRTLGRSRLISIIHPDNGASRRVAEKVGLRVEKPSIHKGIDVLIYSMGASEQGDPERCAET
jgi:RimJ/RimL family protein N-acetyltransferase